VTERQSRASVLSTEFYVTSHQSTRHFTRRQVRWTGCHCHCATTAVCTIHCDIVQGGRATWLPLASCIGDQSLRRRRRLCPSAWRRRSVVPTTPPAAWTTANIATFRLRTIAHTAMKPNGRPRLQTPRQLSINRAGCQSSSTASDLPITQSTAF